MTCRETTFHGHAFLLVTPTETGLKIVKEDKLFCVFVSKTPRATLRRTI